MTTSRGWRLPSAAALALVLVVAGCGGGNGDSDTGASGSPGPLAEFFGWDDTLTAADQEFTEEDRQRHFRVQEHIVDCMDEAGFEYFPEPFWGDREDFGGTNDAWQDAMQLRQDDPEEFAREYGYGVTTIDFVQDAPDPVEPEDDPNLDYQDDLSEAARTEYQRALWGYTEEGTAEDTDDGRTPQPMEVDGCYGEAQREVYGWDTEEEQGQFEGLLEDLTALQERIENDPRVVEAAQSWSSCMADAGYPGLDEPWSAQEQVHERQQELYGRDLIEPDASPVPADREDNGQADVDPVVPERTEPDPEELAAVQEFELEIAWADFECQQEHDLDIIESEVRHEYEEQFIEDHRPELEEYRDWLEGQGALG